VPTEKRLRPKLMTVAAVLARLAPVLWATGVGSDLMKPIAAPIVGGEFLIFATFGLIGLGLATGSATEYAELEALL
jgi:Cu/Ag efflux pump CusA